jgi:diacylglycerol kinase family enzyme
MQNDVVENSEVVIISLNPSSGATDRREIAASLASELESLGFEALLLTDIDAVVDKTNELFGDRLRCVVAAGGDGTISLLTNLLPESTPLAILPLGTENLLAKYLGISADPKKVAHMIAAGNTRQLDVGRANGKLFLVMASCGFDADVVKRLHHNRTGHIRHWSYARPVLKSIKRYRYPKINITFDGDSTSKKNSVQSRWAFAFNVPRYAMNLPIVAEADPEDGQLDLCTFRGGSLFRSLFYIVSVLMRKHRQWTNSKTYQFTKVTLTSEEEVPYQLDGDPGGLLPLTIEVVPGGVTVLVP